MDHDACSLDLGRRLDDGILLSELSINTVDASPIEAQQGPWTGPNEIRKGNFLSIMYVGDDRAHPPKTSPPRRSPPFLRPDQMDSGSAAPETVHR